MIAPPLRAQIKVQPDDFLVEELLGFEADGDGEHLLLRVEKEGANTAWVAEQLAKFAGIAQVAVGYAGLKDRHARTIQYFSLHLPGRPDPDFAAWDLPSVRVLSALRHRRKLPRGALRGNRFELRLRSVSGDRAAADTLLTQIASVGIPNRYGSQRFGHNGANLQLAKRLFAGARLDRARRGFALSAARSMLFNQVLERRVQLGNWNRALPGDIFQLDGRGSVFGPVTDDPSIDERLARAEIHPTGPLPGRGESSARGAARDLEDEVLAEHADWLEGLARERLEPERRALRMMVRELEWDWPDAQTLMLRLRLDPGCYATSVIEQIAQVDDHSGQQ